MAASPPLALQPWCHECSYLDGVMRLRPSSPSTVTLFPKCASPPLLRKRFMSQEKLTPKFLLDTFEAEAPKTVRFAFPLVTEVRECPSTTDTSLFYSPRDIRRFKRERRQIKFLSRMAGFEITLPEPSRERSISFPVQFKRFDTEEDEEDISFSRVLLQDLFLLDYKLFDMYNQ